MAATAQARRSSGRGITSVHEAFERLAACAPDAVAAGCGADRISRGELNAAANRLARLLGDRGTGTGDAVAVCAERSIGTVIALLAVLKTGACYLALDPRQPRERHRALLADAGVDVVLTQERLLSEVAGLTPHAVLLDRPVEALDRYAATDLGVPVSQDSPAYVAYTSGSTGRPKGVVVPHRAVLRLVTEPNFVTIGSADAVLHLAPLAFDASTLEIWAPLLGGARLVVFPAYEPTLGRLATVVEQEGVTVLWLTAGLFHQMVEGPIDRLRGLRYLLAGGDVLSVAHVNKALAALPGTRIVNGYGPTENTTFTCCHVMTEPVTSDTVPIGIPITGTEVHVLDEALRSVARGETGELFAGGDGVALGYLGQPVQTAERFVPDPFGSRPGGRLYRTGDLVRRRQDGVVEFLGRADQQVKIRGFRIEPGEVEAALLAQPGVRDAAVLAQDHGGAGRRLLACYVADEAISVPALRRALSVVLPPYMVPSAFVQLPELPLTRNGKVDRAALRGKTTRERPHLDGDFRPPRTGTEETLATIWGDLMEIDGIGADDDFFELGGHSLLVTRITAEIAAQWNVEVRLRAFYENPTVAELARVVEELGS